jgi:hypothetical protein
MAFRDFSFPQVQSDLGIALHDADLFSSAAPFAVREEFLAFIRDGVALAVANSTEKAKSEFIIAPVLLELRRMLDSRFSLFSGLEWDVDSSRGLNGSCDFIRTKGESQYVLGAPFVAIAEAKNDLIRTGLGQCIAEMYAAQWCNQQARLPISTVYGVVTTGSAWKFLEIRDKVVTIDIPEYYIDNLSKNMGILKQIVESVERALAAGQR